MNVFGTTKEELKQKAGEFEAFLDGAIPKLKDVFEGKQPEFVFATLVTFAVNAGHSFPEATRKEMHRQIGEQWGLKKGFFS